VHERVRCLTDELSQFVDWRAYCPVIGLGLGIPPGASWLTEDKYDGIRCQLHHSGEMVALYSRDLNDVTEQFPEVAQAAAHVPDVILDGEVLAFREGRVLPFKDLQTRLGRRNPGAALLASVPSLLKGVLPGDRGERPRG